MEVLEGGRWKVEGGRWKVGGGSKGCRNKDWGKVRSGRPSGSVTEQVHDGVVSASNANALTYEFSDLISGCQKEVQAERSMEFFRAFQCQGLVIYDH